MLNTTIDLMLEEWISILIILTPQKINGILNSIPFSTKWLMFSFSMELFTNILLILKVNHGVFKTLSKLKLWEEWKHKLLLLLKSKHKFVSISIVLQPKVLSWKTKVPLVVKGNIGKEEFFTTNSWLLLQCLTLSTQMSL